MKIGLSIFREPEFLWLHRLPALPFTPAAGRFAGRSAPRQELEMPAPAPRERAG